MIYKVKCKHDDKVHLNIVRVDKDVVELEIEETYTGSSLSVYLGVSDLKSVNGVLYSMIKKIQKEVNNG